jgi:glycosyltransferase involved in cell wall biosynthesis
MPLAREILSRQPVFATSRAIAVSSAVRTWAVDRLPIAPDRIEVLHNGHDIERFASPSPEARACVRRELQLAPDAPVIGVIGRLDIGQKGQDVMIRALTAVRKRHPDARLLLVGDGPDRGACEGLVRQLGLGVAVRFAGYRSDIPDVLAAVDIVVIPSVCDEGLPFVAIEAGAAGRVAIATRSGGLPEVVLHNESGIIVPKGDVEALSTAVARVLSDPELARRLATNGQRLACRFTLREHVERLMAIYEAMVARPGNCAGSMQ